MMKNQFYYHLFFLIIVVLTTLIVYSFGLGGNFIFDDFANLNAMGKNGSITDFYTFQDFIFSGFSGPTGRPISLASFLLDDNTWPSKAEYFKKTNLLIHIINGLLIIWASILTLRLYNFDDNKTVWIALISGSIWLLHPLFVSTTLYVVQRMAQLATLFIFAGIVSYLSGRLVLSKKPKTGYLLMSLGIIFGTVLATFSKENGALLPLLVLIIEFCKPKDNKFHTRPAWQWSAIFIWLPSAAIIAYLATRINFSVDLWPARDFNQPERLLTQTRILTEYLYLLWIPTIEGRGLFQDGYMLSKSFFEPTTTLYASLFLFTTLTAALLFRKRAPLISLAVLFFFGSHLIESSVIGLELYFEHRNYNAAAFMFLPLAHGILILSEKYKPTIALTVTISILVVLSFMTWQRSTLWANSDNLYSFWAYQNPDSARAQHFVAMKLFENGLWDEGMSHLATANERIPNNSILNLQLLIQKSVSNQANHNDFVNTALKLANHRATPETIANLRDFTEYLINSENIEYQHGMLYLLTHLDSVENFNRVRNYQVISSYLKGSIYISLNNIEKAIYNFSSGIKRDKNIEATMAIFLLIANAGYYNEALDILELANDILINSSERTLAWSKEFYKQEIERFRSLLLEEIDMNAMPIGEPTRAE